MAETSRETKNIYISGTRVRYWSAMDPVGAPAPVMGLLLKESTEAVPVVAIATPLDVNDVALRRTVAVTDPEPLA